MTKQRIIVELAEVKYHFYVSKHPQNDQLGFIFKAYFKGDLVAGFVPDSHHHLQLSENYGHLNPITLNLLVNQIEILDVYGFFEQ